jgi:hypothetical protein
VVRNMKASFLGEVGGPGFGFTSEATRKSGSSSLGGGGSGSGSGSAAVLDSSRPISWLILVL